MPRTTSACHCCFVPQRDIFNVFSGSCKKKLWSCCHFNRCKIKVTLLLSLTAWNIKKNSPSLVSNLNRWLMMCYSEPCRLSIRFHFSKFRIIIGRLFLSSHVLVCRKFKNQIKLSRYL
jgi:hypothetical protein